MIESNRETEDLPLAQWPWNEYQSKDDTEIDLIINGEFSSYDGSGYVRDIDMSEMDDATFNMIFSELAQADWFDRATRAYMMQFTLYDANADQWLTGLIMFEFGISGIIYPSVQHYLVFTPNIFEGETGI